MPTGVLASVLCAQNEMEGPVAGGVVFATTLLSAITIPLALSVLR
jgi:predicted permease